MDCRSPTKGLARDFGEAEIADLPFSDKICHGAYSFLDRYLLIASMQVVKIDHLGAQSSQTGFAGDLHSFGPAVNAHTAMLITDETELCRDKNISPSASQNPAQQGFVVAIAINISGVKVPNTGSQSRLYGGD